MVPRALTLALVCVAASHTHAQASSSSEFEALYDQAKLDPVPTIAMNFLIPGLGNLHARQNFAAVGFFGLFGMGVTATLFGVLNNDGNVIAPGIGLIAIAYTASSITTHYGVQAYNARLRQRYGLPPAQASSDTSLPGLTISWRF